MRKFTVLLGLVLVLGAGGLLSYRWFPEPERHARYSPGPSGGWRGEQRSGRDSRSEPSSGRTARGGGLSSLHLFEIVIDLLNVVVGVVGIWLAVIGVRAQRAAQRQISLRTDA
jgi:hypothetical protein